MGLHETNCREGRDEIHREEKKALLVYETRVKEGEVFRLTKYLAYTSCLDMKKEEMSGFLEGILEQAAVQGYDALFREQKKVMESFWDKADIQIEGDDALQQGIRFNLFHIMQSAGRDGRTGMGAKGLSGEGYEGHYFWDTEMYILPVFVYTEGKLAKGLLDYRYDTLPQARERARVLGHEKGALYPWRTINGEEASTYFPLGTAQYHINADIAYAFKLYIDVTGDEEYLKEKGAEVLIETARVWADVGCFAESKGGKYCICAVTGPDEYNAIVDNNFYTNLMARENLRDALWALKRLEEMDAKACEALEKRLGLEEEEKAYWQKIIDNMYFPYDEKRRVYPLDDGFMMRKVWDDSKIPQEKRHLLYENYHPLFIFRQRMSKQADAVFGMLLHSNYFTEEELRRNYDFYQEVTLHHSSLSTCIFGILASQIGYEEEAYTYFSQSARMDLDDYHNNFYAGIHGANMAGTWQGIIFGFAGLRTNRGYLEFKPSIPEKWKSYRFRIQYRASLLEVYIDQKKAEFILLNDRPLKFNIGEREFDLPKKGAKHEQNI
ncbi:MAG: glycoside hydrolase family 65 protein, partial [Lachnospiraceae bacterium]